MFRRNGSAYLIVLFLLVISPVGLVVGRSLSEVSALALRGLHRGERREQRNSAGRAVAVIGKGE
jgi:hypothetical protein